MRTIATINDFTDIYYPYSPKFIQGYIDVINEWISLSGLRRKIINKYITERMDGVIDWDTPKRWCVFKKWYPYTKENKQEVYDNIRKIYKDNLTAKWKTKLPDKIQKNVDRDLNVFLNDYDYDGFISNRVPDSKFTNGLFYRSSMKTFCEEMTKGEQRRFLKRRERSIKSLIITRDMIIRERDN